jgi:hypothetical protein
MKEYTYSFFAKLVYRFANIPATILMLLYMLSSLVGIMNSWYYIFPLALNIAIIFFINRFYFRSYKSFPFRIEANNTKMICSDYFFSNKKIEIDHADISDIKGGLFSGNTSRPIYLISEKHNETIGLHSHIKNHNELLTTILSNIPQELYNRLLEQTKELAEVKSVKFRKG